MTITLTLPKSLTPDDAAVELGRVETPICAADEPVVVTELGVDADEAALGIVASRLITWGGATLVLIKTHDGFTFAGLQFVRDERAQKEPLIVKSKARVKAIESLQDFRERWARKLKRIAADNAADAAAAAAAR